MKKLLVLPLVFLSLGVIADERFILGSFDRESTEAESSLLGVTLSAEATLNGFGARLFSFKDEGLYLGGGFSFLQGDTDLCVGSDCMSADTTQTMFSGEIGRDLGQWTPFVGFNFSSTEVDLMGETDSDEITGLSAGLWLELDTFKLRGAVNSLDDEDNRSIHGGLLFQMDNKFVFGADFGMLLDDEVDGFRFSLQIGRSF